ncbi:beta-ketoacyl-[acyl-carrier-protein] synthase family protein [Desulfatitalea alkaliphila]|uniref:Beta-ketoacyl-[acyl-carrier-protein] synthase family protein n=1 Tax=Desulfatitalea alkaliphila TaxID=2929485 RepID=A0AA41R4R3_9BACT|nr:beta-ketoacyl-[acyl-carrier-protein] synthase family protein [Desulfatitalea alkaliphila]MCJ8501591.1 beta-ketoacyl-[acyl-carrier-protein] synthase family protein [Desulfatitalea alkaliphila]
MKAPLNRKVYVVGYDAATALGSTFESTWQRALRGEAGFRRVTRCQTTSRSNVVGEIPDWDPLADGHIETREARNWNADFVFLTMVLCRRALADAGLVMDDETAPRTACLIGSALNGSDALRIAIQNYTRHGATKVSPYLLPNLCANLPAGKAGMQLGFTGPIFSPQGACASGNHAIALGARMIRDGDCDFVIAGGVETCLIPEIIQGFANMWATIKVEPGDRAHGDPAQASRPYSIDRKGFVLAEGAGALVLAAEERVKTLGLTPKAEVVGVGWSSDAHHFTLPHKPTIIRAMAEAIDDAGLTAADIPHVNAHGTSTPKGDKVEVECLRAIFGNDLQRVTVTANKSQIGHTLGAAAAIEAALGIEAMRRGILLPTANHIPDPDLADVDVVPNAARRHTYEHFLSNAFGFGGTNCCIVFRGV